MLQVIAAVLADAEDETRLQLVYAVRRHGDVVRKAALLDGWQDYWNFSLLYVVSEVSDVGRRRATRPFDLIFYTSS